jgi:ferredoxin
MSVVISDACVMCGACEWECPSEAISPGMHKPTVDKNRCTECYGFFGESQCIVVCPVGAITVKPEPLSALRIRFESLDNDRAPQNIWIWRRIGKV